MEPRFTSRLSRDPWLEINFQRSVRPEAKHLGVNVKFLYKRGRARPVAIVVENQQRHVVIGRPSVAMLVDTCQQRGQDAPRLSRVLPSRELHEAFFSEHSSCGVCRLAQSIGVEANDIPRTESHSELMIG